MANLDAALRRISKQILDTFGTSVTYRRVIMGEYSTTDGEALKTEIDKTIKGRLDEYGIHEIGEVVAVGDRKLTIAAKDLNFAPSTEDVVIHDGKTYRVIHVKSPQATDQAAIHVLQLRGGA